MFVVAEAVSYNASPVQGENLSCIIWKIVKNKLRLSSLPLSKEDLIAVAVLTAVLSLLLGFYALNQPRIRFNNGRGDDGVHYAKVAEAFLSGNHPQSVAPFVYRVGTPLAAAFVSAVFQTSIDQAFFIVNLGALYFLTILTYVFFRMYLKTSLAIGLAILFLLPYHAPPRWLIFYPILVDNLWSVLIMASLIVMSTSSALTYKGVVFLTLATFLATLTREVGLLIPIVLVMSLYPLRKYISIEAFLGLKVFPTYIDSSNSRKDLLKATIPIVVGLLTCMATRLLVSGTGEFGFLTAAYRSLQKQNVLYFTQTIFAAFGPLLILPVVEWRSAVAHLRSNPAHMVFLILVIALSLIGGKNTIRFLYWGSSVVFLLIGISFQRLISVEGQGKRAQRAFLIGLLAVLVILQIANTHFWHGFYDDYTAWIHWGGLTFSRLRPDYIAICLLVSVVSLVLFRRLKPNHITVSTTTATRANP